MIEHGGVFLPDGERHLVAWMSKVNHIVKGKLTYQYSKIEAALRYVKQFRAAVDVGAHCGLWSMHLAKQFQQVHAFEPVVAHRECFVRNVIDALDYRENVVLYAYALGEHEGHIAMKCDPYSSGDSYVAEDGDISMRTLDAFDLPDVDFIKLDLEGYELFALRGAEETIKRCRPAIIVEQKPGKAQRFALAETAAVDYLEGLGAKLRQEISGDFILTFD